MSKTDLRFWTSDQPHSTIFEHIRRCRQFSDTRRQIFQLGVFLYDDCDMASPALYGWDSGKEFAPTLSLNAVRPNVDTLATQITKARPLPLPVTSDGSANAQRRAMLLGKCIEGQFTESRVWETNTKVVRDGCLHGIGFAYVYRTGNKIRYDRVFPWEIEVDPRDAIYGKPRTMYLTRVVDKLVLQEMYPKYKEKIEKADTWIEDFFSRRQGSDTDSVIVAEAWHLPSAEGARDGWHYITVSNQVLFKERYDYDHFPIFAYYMMPPSMGFFGTGFARMLMGIQYTVNVLAARCQRHAELAPSYLMVPNGSDIQIDQLDNSEWPVITHNQGFTPSVQQPPPFPPQLWEFVKQVFNMSYDTTGVSQTAAQSDLPKALKEASGVALRLHNENRSERFQVASTNYEQFCLDVANHMILLWEEIVKTGGKVNIKAPGQKGGVRKIDLIDYKKVRLDLEDFTLSLYPTTMLRTEPVMREMQIESWTNAGWITPDEAKVLLDFPDVDKFSSLNRAQYEVIDLSLEKMLDEEVDIDEAYTPPEPFWNLKLAVQRALAFYMRAQVNEAPEERLQLIRDFIADVQTLMDQAAPPPQAPPGGPAMPGEAPPAAPPMPQDMTGMGGPVDPNAGMMPPEGAPNPEGITPSDIPGLMQAGVV